MKINFRDAEISFDGKPSAEIRAALKNNRFRWSPSRMIWYGGKLTSGLVEWLERAEGGPKRPDAPCWTCKAPEGFFRAHGPAAPVLCDACHAACEYCAEQKRLRSPNAEVIIRDPGEDAADRWNESYR